MDHQRSFSYDVQRQLVQAVKTAGTDTDTLTFSYDAIGNRTEVARVVTNAPSETTNYAANSVNQYTALTGAAVDSPRTI